MWANTVLKVVLTIPRYILLPVELVTTSVIGLTFLIPFWADIYVWLMTLIWVPFYGYIVSTSWLYQRALVLRPVLAIISIPILLVLDVFLTIMANPDKAAKYNHALIVESWPFSSLSDLKKMDFLDEWHGLSFAISKARTPKEG